MCDVILQILRKYLVLVEDLEVRLCLATYSHVFDVGIEVRFPAAMYGLQCPQKLYLCVSVVPIHVSAPSNCQVLRLRFDGIPEITRVSFQ